MERVTLPTSGHKDVATFFFEWRGVVTWFYESQSVTRGRRWLDGAVIPTGFELWAGRKHLVVEPLLYSQVLRRRRGAGAPIL